MESLGPVLKDDVEDLIDQEGLIAVLVILVEICHAKAVHVRETWQDEPLAKKWEKAATVLSGVQDNRWVREVSA